MERHRAGLRVPWAGSSRGADTGVCVAWNLPISDRRQGLRCTGANGLRKPRVEATEVGGAASPSREQSGKGRPASGLPNRMRVNSSRNHFTRGVGAGIPAGHQRWFYENTLSNIAAGFVLFCFLKAVECVFLIWEDKCPSSEQRAAWGRPGLGPRRV